MDCVLSSQEPVIPPGESTRFVARIKGPESTVWTALKGSSPRDRTIDTRFTYGDLFGSSCYKLRVGFKPFLTNSVIPLVATPSFGVTLYQRLRAMLEIQRDLLSFDSLFCCHSSQFNAAHLLQGGKMTDRRAGRRQGPYVRKQPRSRNKNGQWRRKRSAGRSRSRSAGASGGCLMNLFGLLLVTVAIWLEVRRCLWRV